MNVINLSKFTTAYSITTVLLVWWLSLSATVDQWFNPLSTYSLMTCLAQWAIIMTIMVMINRWILKQMNI